MEFNKFILKIQKISKLGILNIVMCFITRIKYIRLQRKFNFDPWHYKGTYYCRPYQRVAVGIVNKLKPKVVVEVGCGLGEIISRVSASVRIGCDLDSPVIQAAKYLRGNQVKFSVGTGVDVEERNIDILIALNWMHDFSPAEISNFFDSFIGRVSYYLVEAINEGELGYKYYHDYNFLKAHAKLVEIWEGGAGEPRTLMLFKEK